MDENLYLDQEKCIKAAMAIAKAMEYYALTGAENYPEVGKKLNEAMCTVCNELTPKNMYWFNKWLLKKIDEQDKMIEEFGLR